MSHRLQTLIHSPFQPVPRPLVRADKIVIYANFKDHHKLHMMQRAESTAKGKQTFHLNTFLKLLSINED